MAIIRMELVQGGKTTLDESGRIVGNDNVFDILADQKSDLTAMSGAGVGSMAYTRTADNGNQRWVRNTAGWVALDA